MVLVEFIILLLIIAGAAILLSIGAEILADRYGANFTGSIVLGLITTMPEYMFVIWAAIKSEYHMAIGSAIGSCVILVTLGYGLVLIVATTRLSRKPVSVVELSRTTEIDAWYLGGTALVALILAWEGGGLDLKDGILLMLLFGGYMYQLGRHASQFSAAAEHKPGRRQMIKAIVFLVIGALIIFFLTERFVDSMIAIADWMGISRFAIALILGPIASEMPEKLTAYFTVHRDGKLAEISVCNFLGSKVNHNSLLLAALPFVAYFWHGQGNVPNIVTVPFLLMTVITFFAVVNLSRRRLTVKDGLMFAGAYVLVIGAAYYVADPSMFPAGQ